MVDLWKSLPILKGVIFPEFTLINILSISNILSSPGSEYFQFSSFGCPTFVVVKYISPTSLASCLNVTITSEFGDHFNTGLSFFIQPALLVA